MKIIHTFELFEEQLPNVSGPFDWEYIPEREEHTFRLHDRLDNPIGWADSEMDAELAVVYLNYHGTEGLRNRHGR